MPTDSQDNDYGFAVASGLIIWAAILSYVPSYFGFAQHWSAVIVYVVAAVFGLIGAGATLLEVADHWPGGLAEWNDNLAVAVFLGGVAALFHFLSSRVPWAWLEIVFKGGAVVLLALAAMGFTFWSQDAVTATLTRRAASTRRKLWNGLKAALAFVVGLLSAAVAVMELVKAFS